MDQNCLLSSGTMVYFRFALFMLSADIMYGKTEASNKTNSMYGTHYVIALPSMQGYEQEIFFFMTTLYPKYLQVFIWTPWVRERLSGIELVDLHPGQSVSFMINWEYHHSGGTGHKFSYMCASSQPFMLAVLMIESETSSESFQAIPVDLWGTDYFVFTLLNQPSVQIVTSKGPNLVSIKFNKFKTNFYIEVYFKQYGSGDLLEIELREYEAFGLEVCNAKTTHDNATLTGTHISGMHPIGVISGNCKGTTQVVKCNHKLKKVPPTSPKSADVVVEMMLPTSLYGKEFIVVVPEGRKSPGFVAVLAMYVGTMVYVSLHQGGKHTFPVPANEYLELTTEWTKVSLLTSSKPVQVFYVQRSPCVSDSGTEEEIGNPSMTLLMPINLYYDTYKWSTQVTNLINYTMYAGLVVEDTFLTAVQINDQPLPKLTWIIVVGKHEWRSSWTVLPEGPITVRSTNHRVFGCYFYGLSNKTSFLHTGGLISTPINGSWGEWGEWQCAANCSSGSRKRECNNPTPTNDGLACEGDKEERFPHQCPRPCVKSVSNSMGKYFLLALPGKDPEMKHIFLMCTNEARQITVNITIPGISDPDQKLNESVTISKGQVGKYEVTGSHISTVETGKKFTYMLVCDTEFNVNVMIWFNRYYIATLQALPLNSWGRKYFVATLNGGPTVQIATKEANTLTITVRMTGPKRVELMYNDQKVKDGQVIVVKLVRFQGFALARCGFHDSKMRGTLTGTKIVAVNHIGVISGNCEGLTESVYCYEQNKTAYWTGQDAAAEMLMPIDMYGRDFFTFEPIHRTSPGMVQTVAGENNTNVHVHPDENGPSLKYVLHSEGDMRMLNVSFRRITSDKGIMVMVVHRVPCQPLRTSATEEGSTSISLLIPTSLFVDIYLWATHETPEVETKHFVVIIVDEEGKFQMNFDGEPVENSDFRKMFNMRWFAKTMPVSRGYHTIRNYRTMPFGCYLYGIGHSHGVLQSPGYKSVRINAPCVSSRSWMSPADLLDNDCDGKVDEEIQNYRDDDDDGRVDEDLSTTWKIIHGHWGTWTSWICAPNCSMQTKYRWCNDPEPFQWNYDCHGESISYESVNCKDRCSKEARDADATVDGSWSDWSEWHCGYDFTENNEVKKRRCTDPPPKLGGRTCFGYPEAFRSAGCREWWMENKGIITPEEVERKAFRNVIFSKEKEQTTPTTTEQEASTDETVMEDTSEQPTVGNTTEESLWNSTHVDRDDQRTTQNDTKMEAIPELPKIPGIQFESSGKTYIIMFGIITLVLIPVVIISCKFCKSDSSRNKRNV